MKKMTTQEAIEKAKKIHNEHNYDYSLVVYEGTHKNVKIYCKEHKHVFEMSFHSHFLGQKCPYCSGKLKNTEIYIKQAKEKHGNFFDYNKTSYVNSHTKILVGCPIHGFFKILPDCHLNGKYGCKKCYFDVQRNNDYIKKAKEKHGDKYDYTKTVYINNYTNITVECLIHGFIDINPKIHINGIGCQKCTIDNKKTNEKIFFDRCNKIHNHLYDYSNSKYNGLEYNIEIMCKKHGKFAQNAYLHSIGKGCSKCNRSKGENTIEKILINNKIEFNEQHTFEFCKYKRKLPFDFYLPDYNTCIEYDGKQHYEINERFGGETEFKKILKRDKIKTEYCKNNNIRLIRIKYNEDIEAILNEKLFNLI